MRVLLLHPEDSARCGPWAKQKWDLIVDLGKSPSTSAAESQEQTHCPIVRANSFRRVVEDLRTIREMFSIGRRRLLDEEGIDWWDLTSLVVAPQMEDALVLRRLASEIKPNAEIWSTRAGWPCSAFPCLLKCQLRTFSGHPLSRWVERSSHYAQLFRRFSAGQIKQIFFDKYDAGYRWRSRFAPTTKPLSESAVLLPSAYENVSRMAASYARVLPEQMFLLVATRQSARKFIQPENLQVRDLAAYGKGLSPLRETALILANWERLKPELKAAALEFEVLLSAGVFDPFPQWFRDCLRARDAWRGVIEREPITGVLCGDDSNIYTRLPVLLAAKRKIPTVDFHHGALDGRYLLKSLPCDAYLAKSEMERDYLVRVCGLSPERLFDAAPPRNPSPRNPSRLNEKRMPGRSAILFSEPYGNDGLRAEEVYREILLPLCGVSRETGHDVIVKLHPFESASERKRLLRSLLSPQDFRLVTVVDGPTTPELFSRAWFGITIESTTVLECLSAGVPCFLCGWLSLSSYAYGAQYARFGIGEVLRRAEEIGEIPRRLARFHGAVNPPQEFGNVVSAKQLRQLLTLGPQALENEKRISESARL